MISLKAGSSNTWTERARWVDGAAGVVNARNFDDEEGETNTDRSDEGVFGLLGGKDDDGENELGRKKLVIPVISA